MSNRIKRPRPLYLFIPALISLLLALFSPQQAVAQLPEGQASKVQVPEGQFCLNNKLAKIASSWIYNTSIGIKITDASGRVAISSPSDDPLHINWTADNQCFPAEQGGQLTIYYRHGQSGTWNKFQEYRTDWLNGISLQVYRHGSSALNQQSFKEFGVNMNFKSADLKSAHFEQKKLPSQNWMKRVWNTQQNIRFNQLCLPGSHVAGSYGQSAQSRIVQNRPDGLDSYYQHLKNSATTYNRSLSLYLSYWSQTQNQPVYNQLRAGVRYLDTHLTLMSSADDASELAFHSAYGLEGAPLQNMLEDIVRFLAGNPEELIVLNINLVNTDPNLYSKLFDNIEQALGNPRLLKRDLGLDFQVSDQIYSSFARILVIAPNGEDREWVWNPKTTLSTLNSGKASRQKGLFAALNKEVDDAQPNTSTQPLLLAPLYLSPAASNFTRNIVDISSRWKFSEGLRWPSGIARYINQGLREQGQSINVVLQDFAHRHSAYQFCIAEMNNPVAPKASSNEPVEVVPEPEPVPEPEIVSEPAPERTPEPVIEPETNEPQQDEALQKENSQDDALQEDRPQEEATQEQPQTPTEETPAEADIPSEQPQPEQSTEQLPTEEPLPLEPSSIEVVPAEDVPVEEVPVEEAPVEEVPVEEVPVEEVPVEEVPVEEVPVEEVPVEVVPVEVVPVEVVPVEVVPVEVVPVEVVPVEVVPVEVVPVEVVPVEVVPATEEQDNDDSEGAIEDAAEDAPEFSVEGVSEQASN